MTPGSWEAVSIGDLCEVRQNKREVKQQLKDSDDVSFIPMDELGIREKDVTGRQIRPLAEVYKGYTYFADNDILLAKITPCFQNGKLGIARKLSNGVGFGSSEFFVLRCDDRMLPEFLFYYLSQDEFIKGGVASMGGAVGHQRVPPEYVTSQRIPLPPLSEQRRIVSVLDAAFAGLATATAHTQKNLQNARELFSSHLKNTFDGSGKGWSTKPVTEFADHCLGKMLDKRKNMGTPRPYLRNINVRWFEFHTSDLLEMRIKDNEIDKYSTKRGDLMICEGGYPGRAAIWDSDDPICFQKAIHRVRSHEPIYNVWLLYYLFYQDSTGRLKDHFTGSGILHFTGRALAKLPVPLPPVTEAKALVKGFEEMRDICNKLETVATCKLAALSELKQSLLHRAFRGELSGGVVSEQLSEATP